ncbi:MAG: LuxR C-terminal-related transcriptional regulator [Actinomycetota bacterium]
MSALPTGTVTLLLADVEGSTRLWESRPAEMTVALARLDDVVVQAVSIHDGVRPVEQGEGDSFVVAFSRATDAVACALQIQCTAPEMIRLRIGLHTGEVQQRDDGNYAGPVINRTARLRDLAHGGQTLLSGATESMVIDQLPDGVWLTELGDHRLRDLPRPERVLQLCHADLQSTFPPLRTEADRAQHNFPVHLTRFIGRHDDVADVRQALVAHRLVTLTGAGGIGKTRLAQHLGLQLAAEFSRGAWFVDLAAINDADSVPVAVARALGLPDQPGRSVLDTLAHSIGAHPMMLVLDNCEHLIDTVASMVTTLLGACPRLVMLTTSRESLGVTGEVIRRVPPLSLTGEAVELFVDRARRVRPDLSLNAEEVATITDICHRLDGMPLAIELAAARSRSLSLTEIAGGLHDRFRLLTGGARTAVRRQQTMRASVEWSYTLLTESEQTLFRRFSVFVGGCDLAAAEAVVSATDIDRWQVLDLITLLVDKSLVQTEDRAGTTRYRMLETVRQFASERLAEGGDADTVRGRHCAHYCGIAALLDAASADIHADRVRAATQEMDNLQAAFVWSRDVGALDRAMRLASSLQPVWLCTGRVVQGMAWFDAVLADPDVANTPPEVRARALANSAILAAHVVDLEFFSQAKQSLALAREVGDEALLARALTACGSIAAFDPDLALPYLTEAETLTRSAGDLVSLGQILAFASYAAVSGAGDPTAALRYGVEGRDIGEAVGDHSAYRWSRWAIGDALYMKGECAEAITEVRGLIDIAEQAHDVQAAVVAQILLVFPLSALGAVTQACEIAAAAVETSTAFTPSLEGLAYAAQATAALAAGDVRTATLASESADQRLGLQPAFATLSALPATLVALVGGRYDDARAAVDVAVSTRRGWHLACALRDRARVRLVEGEVEEARGDAVAALAELSAVQAYQPLADLLEILAMIAGTTDQPEVACRIWGAAHTIRERTGMVRLPFFDTAHLSAVASARAALGQEAFDTAWTQGAALTRDEAIAYAQRGLGKRVRSPSGWGALTPTEKSVAHLVGAGLANKDIAARMFISVRTVQAHLTHVYGKLGLSSRVQLATEASRHPDG